jgi:hypothetical protein
VLSSAEKKCSFAGRFDSCRAHEKDLELNNDDAENVVGGHKTGAKSTGAKTEAGYLHTPATASSPSTWMDPSAEGTGDLNPAAIPDDGTVPAE